MLIGQSISEEGADWMNGVSCDSHVYINLTAFNEMERATEGRMNRADE